MNICDKKEKMMFEFVNFLKRNKLTISDRDVAPVFKLKYDQKMNIAEYSSLLSLLESQMLLDMKKSVNKSKDFYTQNHKLFIELANKTLESNTKIS
jgi:hypothetical protein